MDVPAIGTEPFGFEVERCARAMLSATIAYRARGSSLQRAGFCAFVPKPVLPKELLDAVERCLEQLAADARMPWVKLPAYGIRML